jgi:TonB family protein
MPVLPDSSFKKRYLEGILLIWEALMVLFADEMNRLYVSTRELNDIATGKRLSKRELDCGTCQMVAKDLGIIGISRNLPVSRLKKIISSGRCGQIVKPRIYHMTPPHVWETIERMKKVTVALSILMSCLLLACPLAYGKAGTKEEEIKNEKALSSWLTTVNQEIRAQWKPSPRKKSYVVRTQIKVHKNGDILGYKIVKSSGDVGIDEEVVKTIRKVKSLTPIRSYAPNEPLIIEYTFDYAHSLSDTPP